MAVVIAICGKIASGKSFYARRLSRERNAVVLSCDELVLSVMGSALGDRHDEITRRVRDYLLAKSTELVGCGCNVILDWGFWGRNDREQTSDYFRRRGIACEWHYIDVSDEDWRENIARRNEKVLAGQSADYYVDEGLLKKLASCFELPDRDEMDVWYDFERK